MTIALGEDGQPIWGNRQANAARKRSYRERLAAEERKAAQLLDEVAASALATLALRQHADMRTLLEERSPSDKQRVRTSAARSSALPNLSGHWHPNEPRLTPLHKAAVASLGELAHASRACDL